MSQAVALAWALKVQEAERLLHQKQDELQRSRARHSALSAELKQERAAELELRVQLLQQQEQLARAKRLVLTRQQRAEELDAHVQDDSHATRIAVASAAVHASMARTRKALEEERERARQWEQELQQPGAPLHQLGEARAALQDTRGKIKHVEEELMPRLRERLDCAPLEQRAAELQARLDEVEVACAAEAGRLAQLADQTRAADEEAGLAKEQVKALQLAALVGSLQGQVAAAQREQATLQGQLEGMEAWLAKLKHESSQGGGAAGPSPPGTGAGRMWHT